MKHTFKAALIDLDGLLINSEHLYLEANQTYFETHNFVFTEEHHRQGTGKKFENWITTIVPTTKSGEELLIERNVIFFDLVQKKLALLDGAEAFLTMLHKNFKTALVTSSKKDYVTRVFEKVTIKSHFDKVFTGEMVKHGKPDSECYLMAAKALNVSPEECLVFEDSPNGIMAGKNAGMKVIAVPSQYVKGDVAFTKADIVVEGLKEITLAELQRHI